MWSAILRDAREGHPALVTFAGICVGCAVATGIALLIDSRIVNGAPVWHKPLKFFVSVAIYSFTFAWYLGQDPDRERQRTRGGLASWLGTGVWVALAIELVLIAMQAMRGVGSHFNISTWFDARVFNVMGLMILALTLIHTALWMRLLRARWTNRPRLIACRWGAGLTLIGLSVGALMVRPRPDQLAEVRAGRPAVTGGHSVGAPDGGPGLPLVNWSTEAGDRRVGHFVGLHAMQAIPAVVLLAPARWPQMAVLAAVRVTGLAYGAITLLLIMQAQQARPVLRPGAALGIAGVLAVAGWIVSMVVIARRADASALLPPGISGGKNAARV